MRRPAAGPPTDPAVRTARPRLWVVGLCFALAFASVGLRLVDIGQRAEARLAGRGDGPAAVTTGRRDLVDRRGELLATDLEVPSVYADATRVGDPARAAARLARVLRGVDAGKLAAEFATRKRFVWVKHHIDAAEQRAVLELGIPGVDFRYGPQRLYPKGALAAHAVGYVDLDNRGIAGLEKGLDETLRATGEAGPVRLSLDLRVQHALRDELAGGVTRYGAKGGNGIVMDVRTGEILALVSLPDFDPNRPGEEDPVRRRNRNTAAVYEVGSLFKVFSFAMALEARTTSFDRVYDATEPLRIGRFSIRDVHPKRRPLTMPEVFMFSSNIGTSKIALEAGAENERSFLERLGLFQRPTLEIPELRDPLVPKRWPDTTIASVAFGHTLAVSPLHVATAFATIVNGGRKVTPTLLRRDGPPPEFPQVVSERTARDMRWLLWATVERGSGARAKVNGYLIGGKTGTAEKAVIGGRGYQRDAVLSSFMAAFPIDAPRYVVLIMLDEPQATAASGGERFGGSTSAPIAAAVISRIGPLLGVPRSTEVAARSFRERLVVGETFNQRKQRREETFAALDLR